MAEMPVIDLEKCTGCSLCVSVCTCRILSVVGNKVTLIPRKDCHGCRTWCTLCEDICPEKAITCSFDVVIENQSEMT